MKNKLQILFLTCMTFFTLSFFIYPASIIGLNIIDSQLRSTGQSSYVPMWFKTTTKNYTTWTKEYLENKYATTIASSNVSATEWPMFGSVFFLLTTEELHKQKKIDIKTKELQQAIENAVKIITSPDTATWVKKKWKKSYLKTGKSYLEKENVFYRMLLIMGISSYEKTTLNTQYHTLLMEQAKTLLQELSAAPFNLLDDYPDQCYPNDVLWAIAAIKKADSIDSLYVRLDPIIHSMMHNLNTIDNNTIALPPFQVNAKTAHVYQAARGSATSGILQYAPMLDIQTSSIWYKTYVQHFWKETRWLVGFREFSKGTISFTDVDTGPIIFNIGSVASLFGIGASKGVGQLNHTVPLTLETIAYAWPTPFGFLLPSLAGKLAIDSWALGDVALLFTMTRPIYSSTITPFTGVIPLSVWLVFFIFLIIGIYTLWIICKHIIQLYKFKKGI